MRIYGKQKCKQYGTHGIQFPHDIDLHTKRKVSVPKQDIGLTHSLFFLGISVKTLLVQLGSRLDIVSAFLYDSSVLSICSAISRVRFCQGEVELG